MLVTENVRQFIEALDDFRRKDANLQWQEDNGTAKQRHYDSVHDAAERVQQVLKLTLED
jgi:hypothetical protein